MPLPIISYVDTMKYKVGGYIPDPPGNYKSFSGNKLNITKSTNSDVDLRIHTSPRHSQTNTSTCVAQSVIKALELKRIMKHGFDKHVDLSIADLYWNARNYMEPKMTHVDDGTYISLACYALKELGVCREVMHPFSKENLVKRPSVMAAREGRLNRIRDAFKLFSKGNDRVDDILKALHSGNPVVFGTQVGHTWMGHDGTDPIRAESNVLGGHAMVVVGFVGGNFVVENSWGHGWGDNGFGYVDPSVFADNISTTDCWVIADGSEAWYEGGF